VELVVASSGVTFPATVICSADWATCSVALITASWPVRSVAWASHFCSPGTLTDSLYSPAWTEG